MPTTDKDRPSADRPNTPNRRRERRRMVQTQLIERDIRDRRVLHAMDRVPRHEFVSAAQQDLAYFDQSLPLPHNQSISQPYIVALMAELAELRGDERVLEIGAGSGYGAAVLASLAERVETVERHSDLAGRAKDRLRRLGFNNVTVHLSDGRLGLASGAPYDAIVVTAVAPAPPPDLIEQLAEGGRLVLPIGVPLEDQRLTRITRTPDGLRYEDFGSVRFVPLVSDPSV